MRSRCCRLLLVPVVAAGLAILVTGCESEEIKAARLDAEAKWAAALEARAAVPTEERIENARHAVAVAQHKTDAIGALVGQTWQAIWDEAKDEAEAAGSAATRSLFPDRHYEAAYEEVMAAAFQRAGVGRKWQEDPGLVAAQEVLRRAQQELRAAERKREAAIELAEQLTAVAEEATAFLEAGKRAQR